MSWSPPSTPSSLRCPRCILGGALLAMALAAGCDGSDSGPSTDGTHGGDVMLADLSPRQDGEAPATVDFVVSGCAELGPTLCSGVVPLRLSFSALFNRTEGLPTWDMGDGSKAIQGEVVQHVYSEPGSYDVSVTVSDGAGTVSELKPQFVVVQPAPAGAVCTAETDCGSGSCVCDAQDSCPLGPQGGLCLQPCELNCPDAGTACVDLSLSAGEPWRTALCLQQCVDDGECGRPGFRCGWAPSALGWRQVCMPATVLGVGAACLSASGAPQHGACAGGLCLELGASGYCSWPCQANTCPTGSRCAKIADRDVPVCLQRCVSGSCATDPLLSCEPPGGSGAKGFTILGKQESAETRFCAPRPCSDDGQCGLAGSCQDGYCGLQ